MPFGKITQMKTKDAVSQARLGAFKGELGKHLSWILLEEELNIFKRNSIHVYSNGTKAFLNLKKKKKKSCNQLSAVWVVLLYRKVNRDYCLTLSPFINSTLL